MRFNILLSRTTTRIHHRQPFRTLYDGTFIPVRDRGLDHAVEREKNLKPLLNLKNLLKKEPSKSLPVSTIKESLHLPFRPIDFVRKYPSIFQEFHLAGFQPHIKLTSEALNLDADEQLMYNTDSFKQQTADRLLKLLMIARIHKIPLRILESLRWDLGLPQDYVRTVVPEFPDCFRVTGNGNDADLELVCWCSDMAVSVLEKNVGKGKKGKELEFPVQFSSGFEMDKKYGNWLRDWNKLPYVSPYENAANLPASSDESDRWVVGVLHEILNLLVSKKTEKDNVLLLGEWLGLESRFKRALLQHPGIFYLSSKNRTYTVVLKDGYKRGLLIEDNPAMEFRRKYIHLMNTVIEDSKKTSNVVQGKSSTKESNMKDCEGKSTTKESSVKDCEERKGEGEDSEIDGEGASEWSDDEDEDASETVSDDEEEQSHKGSIRTAGNRRGRDYGEMKLNKKMPLRNSGGERSTEKFRQKTREENPFEDSKRIRIRGGRKDDENEGSQPRSRIRMQGGRGGSRDDEGSQRRSRIRMQGGRGGSRDDGGSQQRSRTGSRGRHRDDEGSQQRSIIRMQDGHKDDEGSQQRSRIGIRGGRKDDEGSQQRQRSRVGFQGGRKDDEGRSRMRFQGGRKDDEGRSRMRFQGGRKDDEGSQQRSRFGIRGGDKDDENFQQRSRKRMQGGRRDGEDSQERSRSSKSRGRSLTSKKAPVL